MEKIKTNEATMEIPTRDNPVVYGDWDIFFDEGWPTVTYAGVNRLDPTKWVVAGTVNAVKHGIRRKYDNV